MDINEVTTTEDLWTPYKELAAVVDSYLSSEAGGAPYAVHTFEAVLRRQAQAFRALPHNPPKNPASREEIKRGVTEGVNLPSIGKTVLSKELVDEAIIISDMFNVNEYLALELLHTAQRQGPRHPGLARGLLAVLLYYDGRRALLQALKELLTARDGVCWSINAREDIVKYVSRYVEQLIRDGLLAGVLDSLRGFTLAGQLALLQQHRALPPRDQHARLARSIEGSRKLLAGVVFAASAQRGLERETLLRLINEQTTSPSQGPTGALDDVSLALQMALLYALDLSVLHRREDGEELAKKLPLIQDPELIGVLVDELLPSRRPAKETKSKAGQGARALCQLSLGLALAALRRAPQSLSLSRDHSHRDEELVDAATDNKVFEYLDEAVLSTDLVVKEEYYQRRLHTLLTDFIVLMHSKLVEMRVKADEAARAIQVYVSEGLTPPPGAGQSRARLDALLRCVERLYARDPRGLRHEYWQAAHAPARTAAGGRATILYKFVRLSGELVCPALLAGYLRALAALAVPRHTWALLARRDALSAHHLLSALRRYRGHLRTDVAPFSETMHAASLGGSAVLTPAARPGKLLVRQEEVEAMIAALKLIEAVAREDPAAGAAICENLQWDAVDTMFGLMCCHIPIQLKAALCATLGALGGAAGAAAGGRVWAALEAAQLVGGARGVQADLAEIETRMEEYPLTIAFLKLLISLCTAAPLPRSLGAGARAPGLDPYVDYVINKVALPASHRPYKRPAQRHQILSLCYQLLSIWLEQYRPSAADFPPPAAPAPAAPPPGFRVLAQLHAQTDLLRAALAALDEAPGLLDAPVDRERENYLEECITHILTILERALALERAFVRSASEAGRSVLVLGLSKLILEPGPGGSDRLTHCCRILAQSSMLPACAERAAALLSRALLEPTAARHLQEHIGHRVREARHWFVECLDAEEGPDAGGASVRRAKELLVGVLQHALPSAAPNLAHLLLGYLQHEDISLSALHEPGVAGSPRTCFHSVLDILDAHIARPPSHDRQADDLIESCYRLVYWLCARANTSAPALRLLRARDHFLSRHVKATVNLQTAHVGTLSSRSWVLRLCASEVGCACVARQHAAVAALLRALAATRAQEWEGEGCLLRRCLSALPVSAPPPPEPHWELFNPALLAQAIASCDLPAGPSSKRISVSRVHALLARDLAGLPVSQPQRALVSAEIQKVLDYVTAVNKQRNLAATLTHYYDSWRQLTEIIFCVVPQDLLSVDVKKNLLISILQDLLNKIPDADPPAVPQLGVLASGTVLLLLVNLRHCYMLQRRESSMKSSDFDTTFLGSSHIVQTKSLPLKFILHKILSWIFISGDQSQKLRVNLYGALLNFLNIVSMKQQQRSEDGQDATYVSRLDASRARPAAEDSSLKTMVIEDIKYYGNNLYTIIGADCVRAGHDACRMVALACIDSLIDIDPRTDWIDHLSNQGFLRSLIDGLVSYDEGLREAVEPNPKSLRVIYLYESKMALLVRVAGSAGGAEALLAHGVLQALAELTVLRAHPDIHAPSDQQFVPDQADRYRQILIPALALCDALLTTLGSENESCVQLIMHFLHTNVECVDMVLRAAHPTSSVGLLTEVEWLTSVLARCSACAAFGAGEPAAERAERTRPLLAALLPRFRRAPTEPGPQQRLYYPIVCNILTFTRNTVESWLLGGGAPGPLPPHSAVLAVLQDAVAHAHRHHKALHTARHQPDTRALMQTDAQPEESPAERVRSLRRQLQQSAHAACLALHLLWRVAQCSKHETESRSLNGTWQSTPSLVPGSLRKELAGTFSERFTQSLLECAESQTTQRLFLDVIVKDIKTMMQF